MQAVLLASLLIKAVSLRLACLTSQLDFRGAPAEPSSRSELCTIWLSDPVFPHHATRHAGPEVELQRVPVAGKMSRPVTAVAFGRSDRLIAANASSIFIMDIDDTTQARSPSYRESREKFLNGF